LEQLSAERFKAVMDTNFYDVVNVTRAAVPLMREQRSGCILQISSVGGRLTRPGSADRSIRNPSAPWYQVQFRFH
jgi:NAD(P)-dependent dehydrogenase (short-subunit alcohol dehydrogenase family)